MSTLVETSTEKQVRTICLNRPDKRNALNGELVTALHDALDDLEADEAVRAAILAGNGSAFSAGADLASLREMQSATPRENERDSRRLAELFRRIYLHPTPIIAQVDGPAIGGGCGLAAVCDFSLVAPDVRLGFSEVRIGFVPAIVMVFVRRKLGETQARDLMLRGRLLTGREAADHGLVTRSVSSEDLVEACRALGREIATKTSGTAVGLTKRMLAQVPGMGLSEALDYAVQMNAYARGTEDCQAGIAAFLDDEAAPWEEAS
jgi:methylglutaconyl-CoA hydratase